MSSWHLQGVQLIFYLAAAWCPTRLSDQPALSQCPWGRLPPTCSDFSSASEAGSADALAAAVAIESEAAAAVAAADAAGRVAVAIAADAVAVRRQWATRLAAEAAAAVQQLMIDADTLLLLLEAADAGEGWEAGGAG